MPNQAEKVDKNNVDEKQEKKKRGPCSLYAVKVQPF